MMNKADLTEDIIILDRCPEIGSFELNLIIAYANRDENNPAVIKYRSSYIRMTYYRDWDRRDGLKVFSLIVQIPKHPWTPEEPWTDRIRIPTGTDLLRRLRDAIKLIDVAESFDYNMVLTLNKVNGR
jgi:hypothetical protein